MNRAGGSSYKNTRERRWLAKQSQGKKKETDVEIDSKAREMAERKENICQVLVGGRVCGADMDAWREMMGEEHRHSGQVVPNRRRSLQFFCNLCGAGFPDLTSLFKHLEQPHEAKSKETVY